MKSPSVAHATFVIERRFAAPVGRVFATWSNPEKKQRWFACHEGWKTADYQLQFREGGVEINDVVDGDGRCHGRRGRRRREGTELGLARIDAQLASH